MPDLSGIATLIGSAAIGATAVELLRALSKWRERAAQRHQSDTAVKDGLRDALLVEIARLRARVETMELAITVSRKTWEECEARSLELAAENASIRSHADRLASRVAQLEARRDPS